MIAVLMRSWASGGVARTFQGASCQYAPCRVSIPEPVELRRGKGAHYLLFFVQGRNANVPPTRAGARTAKEFEVKLLSLRRNEKLSCVEGTRLAEISSPHCPIWNWNVA